ncbi:hypothetical protein GCM10007242_46100 [Pigmentiphaga litoralis]|nr:hypothetical protein GCM10007242_46100 [Pigmentiphaga litoralis]
MGRGAFEFAQVGHLDKSQADITVHRQDFQYTDDPADALGPVRRRTGGRFIQGKKRVQNQ